ASGRRRADRAACDLRVSAHALHLGPVLDGRGDHHRGLLALAERYPWPTSPRREPAAVLSAAAWMDVRVRLKRIGHPLAVAAVWAADSAGWNVGRLEPVWPPSGGDGCGAVRVQRLAHLLRAGDAHVRADGAAGDRRHRRLRARVRIRAAAVPDPV